jgi:hypothetical protein
MSVALTSTVTQQLAGALKDLQYGSIQLVIHEGEIVRIERLERTRLPVASSATQAGLTVSAEAPLTSTGRSTTTSETRHA